MMDWILLGGVVAAGFYAVSLYNGLVKNRQMVEEGWSGIDVQLKRRFDLIPNLIETVKGYMTHEKDLLTEVTELRAKAQSVSNGTPAERSGIEGMLTGALGRIIAVAENYPDLKANDGFKELQDGLNTIEDEIQLARRYYNGAVRNLNVAVESFPSNLIAKGFQFEKAEYFELENEAERATPKVSFS